MRKILFIIFAAAALEASAQVEKRVEVTKNYAPELYPSERILAVPEVKDDEKMRPEIDYSITPKSVESALSTRKFSPAAVTYWQFSPQYPFYLKAGIGYPLNTVVDFYATTSRKEVGYAMLYLNHAGRFSEIPVRNPLTDRNYRNNSQQMTNRIGGTAGKYFGPNVLEGDIYYESDFYNRYPYPKDALPALDQREINYENVAGQFSFGSKSPTTRRFGFRLSAGADYYNDKSECLDVGAKYRQIDLNAGLDLSLRAGIDGRLDFGLKWKGCKGFKDMCDYRDNALRFSASYSYNPHTRISFRAGAALSLDWLRTPDTDNGVFVMPDVKIDWDITGKGSVVPFAEADGELRSNSYRSLLKQNYYSAVIPAAMSAAYPLIHNTMTALPSSAFYGARLGIAGHTRSGRFSYRISADLRHSSDDLFWYCFEHLYFGAETGRRTTFSLNGYLEYKPVAELLLSAGVKGLFYRTGSDLENAVPSCEASFRCVYTHTKFSVGVYADFTGKSQWTVFEDGAAKTETLPSSVDLELRASVRILPALDLFVEGHNLACRDIYRFLRYREYGIGFTVGVKYRF